ncbi:DRTGG domain-containing protein [Spirochaetota bacterium]
MKVSDLATVFGFEELCAASAEQPVRSGYTSDLLSDVMAKAKDDSVLITIQAHKNSVAVATLVGIRAIVICNSRPVPDDMKEAAKSEGIAIYRTDLSQFEVSGLLYTALKKASEGNF